MRNRNASRLAVLVALVVTVTGLAWGQGTRPAGAFYYGWKGERVPLKLSTERMGITFENRISAGELQTFVGADPLLDPAIVTELALVPSDKDMGRTVVLRMAPGLDDGGMQVMVDGVRLQSGVESTHPVYSKDIGNDAPPESLLTDFISVVVRPGDEQNALDLFEQDDVEVVWRSDYSEIGMVGFRLKVTRRARTRTGEDVLDIANRYHEHAVILEAAPAFSPLDSTQMAEEPTVQAKAGHSAQAKHTEGYHPYTDESIVVPNIAAPDAVGHITADPPPDQSGNYFAGDEVTFTVWDDLPNDGWEFCGWNHQDYPKATDPGPGDDWVSQLTLEVKHSPVWSGQTPGLEIAIAAVFVREGEKCDPYYYAATDQWNFDEDPPVSQRGGPQWYFRQMNAAAAWAKVYGDGEDPWAYLDLEVAKSGRIILAQMDNGVAMDFTGVNIRAYDDDLEVFSYEQVPDPKPTTWTNEYNLDLSEVPSVLLTGHRDLRANLDPTEGVVTIGNQWFNNAEVLGDAGVDDDENGYPDDYFGWDFAGKDTTKFEAVVDPTNYPEARGDRIPHPDYMEEPVLGTSRHHGTQAAGFSASNANDNEGNIGVCPSCLTMPMRFHSNSYHDDAIADVFTVGRAEQTINYASATGAHVLALGMNFHTYDPLLYAAVRLARARGRVMISSPAQSPRTEGGWSLDTFPSFPSSWPEVIAPVASDENGHKSPEINYGWAIDLAAPSNGGYVYHSWGPSYIDQEYVTGGGTSSAFPRVTGLAGLMLTVDPSLSPTEIQVLMQETATDLDYTLYDESVPPQVVEDAGVGRDRYTGYGRIDMEKAVALVKDFFLLAANTISFTIDDENRPGGKRNILSVHHFFDPADPDEGMESGLIILDGVVQQLATESELTPTGAPGEVFWFLDGGTVTLSDDPSGTSDYVARLDPGATDEFGNPQWPTLYLKGSMTVPCEDLGTGDCGGWPLDFVPDVNDYTFVRNEKVLAIITTGGSLRSWQRFVIQGGDMDTVFNLPGAIHPVTSQSTMDSALLSADDGDIIEVSPGIYNAIDLSTFDGDVVIRSTDPHDPEVVASTIIQAGDDERAITLDTDQTDDTAIIGFTIRGNGSNLKSSGGIDGGGSTARILYNVFVDNKQFSASGGAIADSYGLIEGNLFGRENHGNQAVNGGALYYCLGLKRKNVFRFNSATTNGGAMALCGGGTGQNIVQNFFANNVAGIDGGALYSCRGNGSEDDHFEISSNIFYDNTAQNGGALADCDLAIIERNTIFGNHATAIEGGGGLHECNSLVTFRNNIIWGNTAVTIGYEQISIPWPGPTYSCIQGSAGNNNNNNINTYPEFVSESFAGMTDDFDDGNLVGWASWGPAQWTAQPFWAQKFPFQSGLGILAHDQTDPDFYMSFRYLRRYCSYPTSAATVRLRHNGLTFDDPFVRLVISHDVIYLDERQIAFGGVTLLDSAPLTGITEIEVWYTFLVKAKGPRIIVWRAKDGESMVKILDTSAATVTETKKVLLTCDGTNFSWFDDISFSDNYDDFLHLDEGSPCIDQRVRDEGTPVNPPWAAVPDEYFRDFDDQLGPLEGGGPPDYPTKVDMGADEVPTPEASVFWWERFERFSAWYAEE